MMVYYKKHILFWTLSMILSSVEQSVLEMISIHCKVIYVSLNKMSFTYGITFINLIMFFMSMPISFSAPTFRHCFVNYND